MTTARVPITAGLKFSTAITPTDGAAGTSDISGTTLDMTGFDGVYCVVRMGAIVANAVTTMKWQSDTVSSFDDDPNDLTGTSITIADDDDGEIFISDLFQPRERYVRVVVPRATQNATVAEAHYVQYRGSGPQTQGSGVTLEQHRSPVEGTA